MTTYEFRFGDGTRLAGDGNDPAEGLLDAYRRNGFLPISNLIETVILTEPQPDSEPVAEPEQVEVRKNKSRR